MGCKPGEVARMTQLVADVDNDVLELEQLDREAEASRERKAGGKATVGSAAPKRAPPAKAAAAKGKKTR